MSMGFWVYIKLDPALTEELTEETVKQVCDDIHYNVAGVIGIVPADPETYVGD